MTGLKVWLDNLVEPPDDTWDVVVSSEAAIALLTEFQREGMLWHPREAMSLTHNLAGDDTTRPVVNWMIENNFRFDEYYVHTNQPGREWLVGMISRYLT